MDILIVNKFVFQSRNLLEMMSYEKLIIGRKKRDAGAHAAS